MWWFLAREVLRLRGELSRETPWNVMVDLFFYRKPEEIEAQETADEAAANVDANAPSQWEGAAVDTAVGMSAPNIDWAASADSTVPMVQPIGTASLDTPATTSEEWGATVTDNWTATASTEWGSS